MSKYNSIKTLAIVMMVLTVGGVAYGQSAPTPQTVWDCQEGDTNYMWPTTPSPCPEVLVMQKHAHTPVARYREKGWDTVVTCENRQIVLTCTPNVPVQRFNGTYWVDPIPYDPPDTTFALGTRMPISTDDNFSNFTTTIPYPFYFFGIQKTSFVLGANGLVAFGPVPVTNTSDMTGPSCPWSYSAGLPWTDNTSGAPSNLNYMRDAIYGVYEDTYPSPGAHSTGLANWGIYYGIQDEYPCRKIICSWNDVPQYSCTSLHCTYQIVCYEGSNIIEVHVKSRNVCSGWNGGNGLIGIQNATGQPQVANSNPTASNGLSLINGKPAAFYPTGYNTSTQSFSNTAFRFTPAGVTTSNHGWYRIREVTDTIWTAFEVDTTWTEYELDTTWTEYELDTTWNSATEYEVDTTWTAYELDTTWTAYELDTTWTDYRLQHHTENDTLREVTANPDAVNDEAGYFVRMHDRPAEEDYPCKSLTKCFVAPKKPTRYAFYLNFRNANGDWYRLADTVFVGVDTVDYLNLHRQEAGGEKVCVGDTARMRVDMNKLQKISHEEWSVFRVTGGDTILLDNIVSDGEVPSLENAYLKVGNYSLIPAFRHVGNTTIVVDTTLHTLADTAIVGDSVRVRMVNLYTQQLPATGLQANKVDTIIVQMTADYESGCHSYATMMINVFPNFDTVNKAGICRGESYTWGANNETYREPREPANTFVKLRSEPGCDSIVRLKLEVLDVSFTVDHVEDCKPYTWLNGKTYTTGNAATASQDTIVLKNRYECDSVVQLDFVIHPLTAKIRSNVDHFTIDNLSCELTDISIGGNSRVWRFPNGSDQTGPRAYYTIPAEMDGVEIILIENSQYGCTDTAKIYIPLNKEHFWVPNAFTPDNPAGNNVFGSVSTKTLREEMRIYNRRGEMVFRCEGVDCKWDGKDMDGNPCVQGAYVYIIRYTNEFEPKDTKVIKGTVTLIR